MEGKRSLGTACHEQKIVIPLGTLVKVATEHESEFKVRVEEGSDSYMYGWRTSDVAMTDSAARAKLQPSYPWRPECNRSVTV